MSEGVKKLYEEVSKNYLASNIYKIKPFKKLVFKSIN